jgi:DNA polymerase-3 subunit gamma/tau
MGQALYRKYRSKHLDEIIGQEHVTTTLKNALKQGRISHAYLLSGPRGVGKTSIARILAHEINGLAYDDEAHLDIIEIDAASNRRIDEIRDLRDRVNTAPSAAKYKVYIIDEVHMLTKEAFNALLKTLEEPPAHVVFILATTEAHKLPETIISRTQRYSLRPVPEDQVVRHLREIASGEKLKIDDDALALIASHGEGSFRDSISLLDQASSSSQHITRADIEHILGLAPDEYMGRLVAARQANDSAALVATLAELGGQGYEPAMVASQLGSLLRADVLAGKSADPAADLELLRKLLDIPAARNPKQLLELVLLETTLPPVDAAPGAPAVRMKQVAPTPATQAVVAQPEPDVPAPGPGPELSPEPAPAPPETPADPPDNPPSTHEASRAAQAPSSAQTPAEVSELWQQALDEIRKQYNTLYGIARMARPELDGNRLTLSFKFAFHQKRLNEAKNRKIFADVVERLHGTPVEIICIVADPAETAAPKPDVAAISNIFGGAELLES